MPGELAVLERQLMPLAPNFAQVLGTTMPPERLIRTVMISVERLPELLDCDRQSLFNSAMSAAVLGLEVDGVTGQAFLIPFKKQGSPRAQLIIGYKGFNTLAWRSGITITGSVVREGDAFDYDLGEGWITHKPVLGNKGRIVAAWAKAAAKGRAPIPVVMGIDDLLAVKARAAGAKRSDSPWNDVTIGFPAMCEKTVKRRLSRSLPAGPAQAAARLDEAAEEQGRASWIKPGGEVVIEGEIIPPTEQPTADDLIGREKARGGAASVPSPAGASEGGLPPASPGAPATDTYTEIEQALRDAAERGTAALVEEWKTLHPKHQKHFAAMKDRVLKPAAEAADKARG